LEQPKVGEQPVVPEYVLEDYYEAPPTFNYEHSKNNDQRDYLLKQVEDDDLFLFLLVSLFLWEQAKLEVQLIAEPDVLEGYYIAAFQYLSNLASEENNSYLHFEQVDQKGHLEWLDFQKWVELVG
jgi:hypothetical protein